MKRTKKQRQQWWRNLSKTAKKRFIDKKVAEKSARRRNRSVKIMKQYGDKYKCSECFHRKTGSCTDDLPNGCEYWYNPQSDYQGIALAL